MRETLIIEENVKTKRTSKINLQFLAAGQNITMEEYRQHVRDVEQSDSITFEEHQKLTEEWLENL